MPVRRCAKTDNVDTSSEFNHGVGVPIWKRVFSAARFHSSWDSRTGCGNLPLLSIDKAVS